MEQLALIARWELLVLLGLMCAAIAWQAISGGIRFAGMLRDKSTGAFDPARLQVLILTAIVSVMILSGVDEMRKEQRVFVDSDALLLLLGAGQGVYLVQKQRQGRSVRRAGTVSLRRDHSVTTYSEREDT